MEISERLLEGRLGPSVPEEASPQVVLVGLGAYGTGAREARLCVRRQRDRDGAGDSLGDFALQDQRIAEVALIRLGPDLTLVVDLDELSGDAHALTPPAEAALQNVIRSELSAELTDVPFSPLVFPRGASREDPQPIGFQPTELRNHLLGQPVTQIFLVRVAGEVVEGKYRERQPPA